MDSIIKLPGSLQRRVENAAYALLTHNSRPFVDFGRPLGEEALAGPTSVSWRVFKNPIALLVGGIAAVILELSDPAVRAGVWNHSSFRTEPLQRLRRTGLAAMVTVYGPRSVAEPMIAAVVRRHGMVAGQTSAGLSYSASDPRLLSWVHATAAYGFVSAYSTYVDALKPAEVDSLYREGAPAARLYQAFDAPTSGAELQALFNSVHGRLEASPVIFEFLQIMRRTPAVPQAIAWMQPLLVRAAVDLIPDWIRLRLGLVENFGLRVYEKPIVRLAGNVSNRIVLLQSPAVQSCLRLGLTKQYLYA